MFRPLQSVVLVALCLMSASLLAQSPAEIRWQTGAFKAYQRAQAEHKPLVVFFYGEGADGMLPWSRKLAEGALASREVAAFQERVVFLKVNVDLDDSSGNVKKLVESLKVTELPTVAVLESQPDAIIERGQIVGYHDADKFVGLLRSDVVKTMVQIRTAAQPPVAADELANRAGQVRTELLRRNEVLLKSAEEYRQQIAGLLDRGQLDGPTFEKVANLRHEAHQLLVESVLDLAALPADEARELGLVLLNLAVKERDQCRQLEQDVLSQTVGGRLLGPVAVERAQSLVREADKVSAQDQKDAQEAIEKAGDKYSNWLNKLAAK